MAGSTSGCVAMGVGSPSAFAYLAGMAKQSKVKVIRVDGPIDPGKPSKARYRTVERDGVRVRLRVIDAESPHFLADFHASFAANVRRARAENRALDAD